MALKQHWANTATYYKGSVAFGKRVIGIKIGAKLQMEPGAEPVAQKPCLVPYHLQKPLKDWLDQEVKYKIFEKVRDWGAITLCSLLIVQLKAKFTDLTGEYLESHMMRANIACKWILKQSMKRILWVQSPGVEDFIYRLHGCKIFTKVNFRQSCNQLA